MDNLTHEEREIECDLTQQLTESKVQLQDEASQLITNIKDAGKTSTETNNTFTEKAEVTMNKLHKTHKKAKRHCKFAMEVATLTPEEKIDTLAEDPTADGDLKRIVFLLSKRMKQHIDENNTRIDSKQHRWGKTMDTWKDTCVTIQQHQENISKLTKERTNTEEKLLAWIEELTCQVHSLQQQQDTHYQPEQDTQHQH